MESSGLTVVVNVFENPFCWLKVPIYQSKFGEGPPLLAVAVKVTLVPAQTVPLGVIVTLAGNPAVTVTKQLFVAVIPQASVAVHI